MTNPKQAFVVWGDWAFNQYDIAYVVRNSKSVDVHLRHSVKPIKVTGTAACDCWRWFNTPVFNRADSY